MMYNEFKYTDADVQDAIQHFADVLPDREWTPSMATCETALIIWAWQMMNAVDASPEQTICYWGLYLPVIHEYMDDAVAQRLNVRTDGFATFGGSNAVTAFNNTTSVDALRVHRYNRGQALRVVDAVVKRMNFALPSGYVAWHEGKAEVYIGNLTSKAHQAHIGNLAAMQYNVAV